MTNNQILLKEIIKQECQNSSEYNNENSYFEFFAANQVLKDYEFSNEEIENGIIGGSNDGGCDAAYIFLNDEIIAPDQLVNLTCPKGAQLEFAIFQSKNTTGFGEDAIMKWKTISENLLDMSHDVDQYKDRYCEGVCEIFMLFRDAITKLITKQPKVCFHYYYVTLGVDVHPNVVAQMEELKCVVNKLYPNALVKADLIGANELVTLYNSEPDVNICVDLADQAITLGKTNEYVALINLSQYYTFITDSSKKLRKGIFESNVRDYQGYNSVNSCIADTLKNKQNEDFWWLNNGITILSDKITLVTSKKLSVDNPEIVKMVFKPLMKSIIIFRKIRQDYLKKNRNILVRFLCLCQKKCVMILFFATNNQTNIPKSSLRGYRPNTFTN